jgi:copper chaperone
MKTVIAVRGMSCGGCVASVEKALGRVPGVAKAKASLETGRVEVDHDAGAADRETLEQAIVSAGFEVPRTPD